jgi:hypothetical protein
MKKLLLIIMIFPVLGTGYLNAQKLSKNDAFDILTKWEGKWKNSAVFEKSVWITEITQTRGITETNLILSNNYLEIMVYNDDDISKHMICYDQTSSQFNRWEFKSDGSNTFLKKSLDTIPVNSFILNKKITFFSIEKGFKEPLKFSMVYLFSLLVNYFSHKYLLNYFDNYLPFIISTSLSVLINFTGLKFYVFKN